LDVLVDRTDSNFDKYTKQIWELARSRYADVSADDLTSYILDNASRNALIILNSERDWKDNSSGATNPKSLFTIIIGGNIVSRGVTLNNLLSMFFTRDVKHKIQQDTYIQRARMFGSRGDYLDFFELTIPQSLYVDWHRCFVFHRLALSAIKDGLGSLVWVGDSRISPVSSSSIDRSTVDLNRGSMSFGLFDYSSLVNQILTSNESTTDRLRKLHEALGEKAFPDYVKRFIERTSISQATALFIHPPLDVSGYSSDTDVENVSRTKGFIGTTQTAKAPNGTVHHVFVAHNKSKKARLIYKFEGNIQFIKNTANDS
jgi:Z1 domain